MRLIQWFVQPFVDYWVLTTHSSAYGSTPDGPRLTCLECEEIWPCTKVRKAMAR